VAAEHAQAGFASACCCGFGFGLCVELLFVHWIVILQVAIKDEVSFEDAEEGGQGQIDFKRRTDQERKTRSFVFVLFEVSVSQHLSISLAVTISSASQTSGLVLCQSTTEKERSHCQHFALALATTSSR
jgi:hypothetical protein